jgi:hypothetical protein
MQVNKRLTGGIMYALPEKLYLYWVFYDKQQTNPLLSGENLQDLGFHGHQCIEPADPNLFFRNKRFCIFYADTFSHQAGAGGNSF